MGTSENSKMLFIRFRKTEKMNILKRKIYHLPSEVKKVWEYERNRKCETNKKNGIRKLRR